MYKKKMKKEKSNLPKGNSGRSMNPCLPASGVKYPRGWTIKCFLIPAASSASFIKRHASMDSSGPKWQLMPIISAPEETKQTLEIKVYAVLAKETRKTIGKSRFQVQRNDT